MANLGQKDGIFNVRFRFLGREFKKSLKIRSRSDADAAKSLIEVTIHRLMTGQITVPAKLDPGDFIVSGGTLREPVKKAEPRPQTPSTQDLIDRYLVSQKDLLAESYHYSQAMHLRHLAKHLGDRVSAECDQVGFRDLDAYLKARLAIRHPNTAERERISLLQFYKWVVAQGFPLTRLSRRLDETAGAFMDTAAILKNVDLVVTSDSAVAHLAGAMGLPVWVALPAHADWRWLRGREDSPWYAASGGDWQAASLGMGLGELGAGLFGAGVTGWMNAQGNSRHFFGLMGPQAWAATKMVGWNAAWAGAGAAIGGYFGGVDGALQGAGYGMLAGNIALAAFPKLQKALLQACFSPETPIHLTRTESKPIIEFRSEEEFGEACDRILTRDEFDANAPLVLRKVQRKFIRTAAVLHVRVGGHKIGTTAEHPLHVAGKGWIPAGDLQVGDTLLDFDGPNKTVDGVISTGEFGTVVNLEIEDCHTYFVGGEDWGFSVWAHNAKCGSADILDDGSAQVTITLSKKDWSVKEQLLINNKYSVANTRIKAGLEKAEVGAGVPYSSYKSKKFVRDTMAPGDSVRETKVPTGKQVDEYVSRQFGGQQVAENQHLVPSHINSALGPIEEAAVRSLADGTKINGFTVVWK